MTVLHALHFDSHDDAPVEPVGVPSFASTSETRQRWLFLEGKKKGDTWTEGPAGRFLYVMGGLGVTVFDTDRWSKG